MKGLVELRPDVIVTRSTPAVRAVMRETRMIPIVSELKMRKISTAALTVISWLVMSAASQSQDLPEFVAKAQPHVSGTVRIQSFGDYNLKDAEWSGSKSLARQLEGITLKLDTPDDLLRVEYRCNVEDVGNIGWFAQDSTCGVSYQSHPKRIEAIQIRLSGKASSYFSVKYECHVQGIGDMPAQADGDTCGTYGESRRLEALRVWVERRP